MSMESREMHVWDKDKFTNYADAKESDAIYSYDVSHADDHDDLKRGLLYETILAMNTALDCVGCRNRLSFALVINGHIVDYW
jgi:hypothetical protein